MKIFTLSQLAKEAHVSRAKVHSWIAAGLPALQVNVGHRRSWRIAEKSFVDFMERQKPRVSSRPTAGQRYPE